MRLQRLLKRSKNRSFESLASAVAERDVAVSSTGGKKIELERFEELEAYRGIAALLIVVFHAYQFSREARALDKYVYEGTPLHLFFYNLDTFVSLFFVLSGFLIFLPFAHAAVNRGSRQSARGFLIRRAIRIVPLYYAAILIVWALYYSGGLSYWIALAEHLSFTQVFSRDNIFSIIGPAWSLSVEVIFYIFIAVFGPLAYIACNRFRSPRFRIALLAITLVILTAVSIAYKWWAFYVVHAPEDHWPVYFGPLAKLDTFAMGMFLALLVVALRDRTRLRLGGVFPSLLRVAALAILAFAFVTRTESDFVYLYVHTICGVAFVMILASTVLGRRGTLFQRLLARPELQYLGLISYSVYLWHEPIMHELASYRLFISGAPSAFPTNALVLAIVSIGVASLSYWGIERPMMHLRYLFTREGRLAQRYSDRGRS